MLPEITLQQGHKLIDNKVGDYDLICADGQVSNFIPVLIGQCTKSFFCRCCYSTISVEDFRPQDFLPKEILLTKDHDLKYREDNGYYALNCKNNTVTFVSPLWVKMSLGYRCPLCEEWCNVRKDSEVEKD